MKCWRRGESGARDRLAGELRRACLEVGFFYVGGHGVEQALVDAAFAQTEAFHGLPEADKAALAINRHNIGYMASRTSMQRSSTVHRATRPNLVASFFMKRERAADAPALFDGTGACAWLFADDGSIVEVAPEVAACSPS